MIRALADPAIVRDTASMRGPLVSLTLLVAACTDHGPEPAQLVVADPDPLSASTTPDPTLTPRTHTRDADGCPLAIGDGVRARFAVGVEPRAHIPGYPHGTKCTHEYRPSSVVQFEADRPKLAQAGSFTGRCPDGSAEQTYAAVDPERLVVQISSTRVELEALSDLGASAPVTLLHDHPEWQVGLTVHPADRCGGWLAVGASKHITRWTLAPTCERVVKLDPYEGDATLDSIELTAVGAGACTLVVEMLGLRAEVPITVR